MNYEYKKELFGREQKEFINEIIFEGIDEDFLNLLTKTINNAPVFNIYQMNIIHEARINNCDYYDIISQIHNSGHAVFSEDQMVQIREGFLNNHLSINDIEKFTILNSDGYPVYDGLQMYEIRESIGKFTKEQFELLTKLDSNGKPVFNDEQMGVIRYAFKRHMCLSYIDIFTKTINEKPIFSAEQMSLIFDFLERSSKEQIKQFKSCIDEGLSFRQIDPFIKANTAPENIRILKSFYDFGCDPNDILKLTIYNSNYDNFKEAKYLLQCADALNYSYDCIMESDHFDTNDMAEKLQDIICEDRKIAEDQSDVVFKLLKYKMPPEQIDYITNTDDMFTYNQMKYAAIGFLNGLNQKEIDEIMKEWKITDEMTSKEIDATYEIILEKINEAVRVKFYDISGIDKDIDVKTDWFEEIER